MAKAALVIKAYERKIPKLNDDLKNFSWTD
jgi:hypothetical protein